jgi:DNA adenine methylase
MASPIVPWIGGKRRLVDLLLSRFPAHDCYCEVFAGGAAVFFARNPANVEVLNDVNGDLINLYRVVTHHLEEFVRQFKWALTSRQVFKWLQDTRPETLTDVQRAARFFYLQQQSFGGKVAGQTFGTATTAPAHLRLAGGTYIEQLDWVACIERYDRPHTLFYLDPPYWGTEGYGVPFAWEQYELMAAKMRSIKGKAIISINDHPEIRECFKGFEMESLRLDYTVGGGANRVERGELVIYSWDPQAVPAGLF